MDVLLYNSDYFLEVRSFTELGTVLAAGKLRNRPVSALKMLGLHDHEDKPESYVGTWGYSSYYNLNSNISQCIYEVSLSHIDMRRWML